jgi:hypothetical protein
VYLIRLSYEPRAGLNGETALSAAREFNRYWVALGMPQMRLLLAPFGQFGAPFVQMDVTVDDLSEAEEALTRLRSVLDPRAGATNPAPSVEILRIVDDPPIDEAQVTETLRIALPQWAAAALGGHAPTPPDDQEAATQAAARAQDVSTQG